MNDSGRTCIISCKSVSKSFKSKAEVVNVLKGVDLNIDQATTCAITGASGSGKSTLLSILGGLERFDSGEIRVGDFDLRKLPEKELPTFRGLHVGFVFQFHYLLKDFSALENVALPAYMAGMSKKVSWERAKDLLGEVGLGDRLHHFPSELSGGERQRTAIARALVNSPAVILADEPTGNLDSENAAAIRDLLYQLPRISGTTVLLATHDADLAAGAANRYKLVEGRLCEY